MNAIFDIINVPLGYVLRFIANIFGNNFAASVFVFTLLVNIAFIPLTIKSQKSAVGQLRVKPKLDELKKKYGNDKQKYSQAMSQLYQQENVSMAGGCLPMIVRLVIMMSIYYLIMSPLTYMANVGEPQIQNVKTAITEVVNYDLEQTKLEIEEFNKGKDEKDQKDVDKAVNARKAELNKIIKWDVSRQSELDLVKIVRKDTAIDDVRTLFEECKSIEKFNKIEKDLAAIKAKDDDTKISYTFFSKEIELTDTPNFDWNIFAEFDLNWIMPLMAFGAQMLSSILSSKLQRKTNPDAPRMSTMLLLMPLISLWIGFSLPCGVTFYWACSSLIGGFVQIAVQQFYGPHKVLAKERTKELVKQCEFEAGQIKKLGNNE